MSFEAKFTLVACLGLLSIIPQIFIYGYFGWLT